MDLFEAFSLKKGDIVALVGAGGKTSLMFAMAREAVKKGYRMAVTTTTKIYHPGEGDGWPVVCDSGERLPEKAAKALDRSSIVVLGAGIDKNKKLLGVAPRLLEGLVGCGFDMVLVEADGAAGRPFKGPGDGEPVIPAGCELIVPVVGVDCLGKTVDSTNIHRPEVVARLAGIVAGKVVTAEVVARVLLHEEGYGKNVPCGCRWIPFINKVRNCQELQLAEKIAALLGLGGVRRVVIGAAQEKTPVREVAEFDISSDIGSR